MSFDRVGDNLQSQYRVKPACVNSLATTISDTEAELECGNCRSTFRAVVPLSVEPLAVCPKCNVNNIVPVAIPS